VTETERHHGATHRNGPHTNRPRNARKFEKISHHVSEGSMNKYENLVFWKSF